jgi:hypothetical protein
MELLRPSRLQPHVARDKPWLAERHEREKLRIAKEEEELMKYFEQVRNEPKPKLLGVKETKEKTGSSTPQASDDEASDESLGLASPDLSPLGISSPPLVC